MRCLTLAGLVRQKRSTKAHEEEEELFVRVRVISWIVLVPGKEANLRRHQRSP